MEKIEKIMKRLPPDPRLEGKDFRPFHLILIFSILIIFLSPSFVWSQIYKWKDEKGVVHFTDDPPARKDLKEIIIRKEREEATEDAGRPRAKEKRPYREIRVVMYMTDWCGYCKKARDLLKSLGVNLIEYNIERDRDKAAESRRKGEGRGGVPVIDVEGIIINGYGPEHIKAAVEKRRG